MSRLKSGKQIHLIGKIFGRLTVIDFDDWYTCKNGGKTRLPKWICLCSCGQTKSIHQSSLNQGLTKSCGCLVRETSSKNGLLGAEENGTFNTLLRVYKRGAKSRKLSFTLSENEFYFLTKGNCYYCDKEPSQIRKKQGKFNPLCKDYIYNGIDRLDSKKGYKISNSVSCCHLCNMMKRVLSEQEFLDHIKRIYNNRIK